MKKLIIGFCPTNCTVPLVTCGWRDLQLDCFKQKGFECQVPVFDTVVVSMNSSFAHKKGFYRCIPHGDGHNTARPCRYPAGEGKCYYFFLGVFMIENKTQVLTDSPCNGNGEMADTIKSSPLA